MDLKNFNLAPLYVFDKEWAVLTAGSIEEFNTMTISWGGLGTIWNKPVATIYVRPNRYTYEFIEKNDYFTISFFDKEYRNDLTILGSKSGRDVDKISLTKLTPKSLGKYISYNEAKLTIVCKKLYFQDMNISNVYDKSNIDIDKFYRTEPMHRMYIGQIIDIIDGGSFSVNITN